MFPIIRPSPIRIPFINVEVELSAKDKKVLAVALATIALVGIQFGASLTFTFLATYFFTTVTYFSERFIRTEFHQQNDWFNTDFDKGSMKFWAVLNVLKPIILYVVFAALGIPFPELAQEGVVDLILSQPWTMIPIATIVAPFSEEILFRGFLYERFEDMAHLLDRHNICLIDRETQKQISNIAQAILFGAAHLGSKIKEGMMMPIWFSLSFIGYIYGLFKEKDGSLISPMVIHSTNNIGAIGCVFLSNGSEIVSDTGLEGPDSLQFQRV